MSLIFRCNFHSTCFETAPWSVGVHGIERHGSTSIPKLDVAVIEIT